ncbi:MAG: hypothetical protein IJT34_08335 [Butyrivibrio sp.]|nr:hypothetical protein [Butyrivibrio sp.]
MKIQCDYCGNTYEDTLPECPKCGGPNKSHNDGDVQPRTIEQLKQWYKDRKLPPEEVTRFFIGKDIREARAFGIYKDPDTGAFIVYKNKDNGERAVRYQGKDEQYAVNELYQKLKDEIVHQKANVASKNAAQEQVREQERQQKEKRNRFKVATVTAIVTFLISISVLSPILSRLFPTNNGYYLYNNQTYYQYDSNWFYYDSNVGEWFKTNDYDVYLPPEVASADHNSSYYQGYDWNPNLNVSDWNDSAYYEEYHSSDSSYDWDSNDSWDSDTTDWGSDW